MNSLHSILKEAKPLADSCGDYRYYDADEMDKFLERVFKALEKAVEQRDGYRSNYWAVTRPITPELHEIAKANDTEIKNILEGK